MKGIGKAVWVCGAAAVVLAVAGMMWILNENEETVESKMEIVIGTYGDNLYRYSFDMTSHEFSLTGTAKASNPSYVLADEEGTLYAVSEEGNASGAYSFKDDEKTTMVSDLRQTGADPCFIMLYKGFMMTADYSGGSISVFPITGGTLKDRCAHMEFSGNGPVEGRQESSHIHQLRAIPGADGYIIASDLGSDVIRLIKAEVTGDAIALENIKDIGCPPGSGPRHMELNDKGDMLYCIAELSGEVLVFAVSYENEEPSFRLVQQIQADEVNAGGSADIHIHPTGKWIYTSHRLDNDGIAVFKINDDGTLEKIGYTRTARHPRNFMITEDGTLLLAACRDDRIIQVFKINEDGTLTLSPTVLVFDQDMPSSITAIP